MADEDPNSTDMDACHHDEPAWDANDPRRQKDQFSPPMEPCECYCLHCNRVFMSDEIWFQRVIGDKNGFEGFWMCPTPNCGGAGFTFDIFPTDPNHPANAEWHSFDDDECDEEFEDPEMANLEQDEPEWDPEERLYKSMDAADSDIEGEEWKFGLSPGDRLPQAGNSPEAAWEEDERRYDEPDQRPRELDWSNRNDREGGSFNEDDIPF
jgi:hypothetical protein